MKIKFYLFLTAVTLSFLASPIYAQRKNDKDSKTEEDITTNLSPSMLALTAEGYFTEGMKHYILQDFKEALKKFLKTYEITEEAAVADQIARTYVKLIDPDNALFYAKKAVAANNKNPFFKEQLADIQKSKGDYKAAIATYTKLTEINPKQHNYFYELAGLHLQLGQLEKAINTYNQLEEESGVQPAVIQQKQRIYIKLGKPKQAIAEGQKLIDTYPNKAEFRILQANLFIEQDDYQEAYTVVESLNDKDNSNGELALLKAKIYRKQENYTDYILALTTAFKSLTLNFVSKKEILREFLFDKEKAADGQKLAEIAVVTHPDEEDAHTLYADFLVISEQYEQARTHYETALKTQTQNYELWERIIQLDFQLKTYETAVNRCQDALEYYPNQSQLYVMLGSAQFMLKEYTEAKAALEQGQMLAMGTESYWRITTQLGDVYHQLGMHEKSDAAYDKVLENDPENIHVLNNYSYYLATRKEKLDQAFQMSTRLIRLGGKNPGFYDTHGWVLYAKEDYKGALDFLQIAAQNTDDAIIVEHYGDTLFQLGEVEKALNEWNRALKLAGENQKRLNNKIEKKQLVE